MLARGADWEQPLLARSPCLASSGRPLCPWPVTYRAERRLTAARVTPGPANVSRLTWATTNPRTPVEKRGGGAGAARGGGVGGVDERKVKRYPESAGPKPERSIGPTLYRHCVRQERAQGTQATVRSRLPRRHTILPRGRRAGTTTLEC